MDNDVYFAKPNIRIEGLVDRFCAWLHTYAPVPAAMNRAGLQLPMLDSFVADPAAHAAAVADPAMKGSYFLNVAVDRADEIEQLRTETRATQQASLALADSIGQAEALLRANADGRGLDDLYARLPANLHGYVELVYDLHHRPQLRFLEALLYRSDNHRRERQSIDLSLDTGAEPPFILSTPRLRQPGHLQLPLRFDHPGIDTFFALRDKPAALADIQDMLGVADDQLDELQALLTTEPTVVGDRAIEAGGRIRYLGHACVLLQSARTAILVDPFISSHYGAGDRFTYRDLPDRLDYVLITHGHQDHVVVESLLQLRNRVGVVVVPRSGSGHRQDPSLRLMLKDLGFTVHEVDDFDEIAFEDGSITATPFLGEHCDLDIRAKSTYYVRVAGRTVFIGADSSGLDPALYRHIRRELGPVDVGFVGMECDGAPLTWLYRPLFTEPVPRQLSVTRRMSGSNAAQAHSIIRELGIRTAYVYAMGEEDWLQHVMATSYTPESYQLKQVTEFLASCAADGVHAEHLLRRRELRW